MKKFNPVESESDVLATLPDDIREPTTAAVRDAFVSSATEMFREWQRRIASSVAQCSPERATGTYLEGLGQDHEVYKGVGEDEESYRARIFSVPKIVTPSAIIEAVNFILEDFTDRKAQLFESELDRWFCCSTSPVFIGANPQYLDRLYEDDSADNGGYVRPQSAPGTAWVFSSDVGRYFVLRVPELVVDANIPTVSSTDGTVFVSSNSDHTAYMFENVSTESELYDLIISQVERIIGQGVRWQLYVDPSL
jgi:hypothetical protein